MIKKAIILAAGLGNRLLPLTIDKPKCLVTLNGISFLENSLHALRNVGVTHAIIVTGYLEDVLKDRCGDYYCGVKLDYISNKVFATTNSMYSLLLALDTINEDVWVLEGDVFFEDRILNFTSIGDLTWLVDSKYRTSGGAYLAFNDQNKITDIEIISNPIHVREDQAKSVGIFCVNLRVLPKIVRWLKQATDHGKSNLYYDLIFKEHIGEISMGIHDINPAVWFEIDTPEELLAAEKLFK